MKKHCVYKNVITNEAFRGLKMLKILHKDEMNRNEYSSRENFSIDIYILEEATYILNFFIEHLEEVKLTGGYLSAKFRMKNN